MDFSVLMSVYKNDNPFHLEQAINSIYIQQTLKPNQVVIVIDGHVSSNIFNVVSRFYNEFKDVVTIVPLEKNVGLGEALRIGTTYCNNNYIFRMDSDDISDKYRFEKQMTFIESHPEVDVLGTYIAEFQYNPDEENKMIRIVMKNHEDIKELAKRRNPMNHVTVCIKKTALINSGGYESCLLLEDYYLWLKMIVNGYTFANIQECLVNVRIGEGFVTRRSSKTRIVGWKKLQNYMLEKKMINRFEATRNMMYLIFFVNAPKCIKIFLYKNFLRK